MFGKNKKLQAENEALKGKTVDLESQTEDLKSQIAELQENSIQNCESIPITDSQAFSEMFLGGVVGGRRALTDKTAMALSAVFACSRLIASAVSTLPVRIYKKQADNQRKLIQGHNFERQLTKEPNITLTAATFWKAMAWQKVINGNAFGVINRNRKGEPIDLVVLKNSRVTVYQAWELGLDKKIDCHPNRLFYFITWDNGKTTLLDQDNMLHVPNIGWDGKRGISTIRAGAESMSLAFDAEDSASELFSNGLQSKVALSYEGKMNAEKQELLRQHIAENHTGRGNRHKPLVLQEGGDVKTLSINASDAQLIEARQYSVIDICRFFGVPPVMIGESSKTSSWGRGVEQMARWFTMFTLNDHLTDFEQEIERKIFRYNGTFCEFDSGGLTRGDTKTRGDYYKMAIGGTQNPAWLTANEVREAEGKPPHPDGDELFKPTAKRRQ